MNRLRELIVNNFESAFVLVVLVSAVLINTVVPYKLVFLNVYFLPVLLAAYYLDLRRSLLGALACVLIAVVFLLVSPKSFDVGGSAMARGTSVFTWGCFLLLTAVIVGDLNQKLRREVLQTKNLNASLVESQSKLEQAGRELKDYAGNLEKKVAERTLSLEQSKVAIEDLKKKVEDALYMTMDPAVVKMLIEGRLRTEKRRVSVLFSDLEKFTTYSAEKRPEMVIGDLNKYLADMEAVLLAYRGHIDKYMGDGIMVEFGAPVDYEQQALLAVLAGYKMQQRIARKGYPWKMRVGIATGDSIIGLVGNQRQSYTAIGDTVNSASRIQELCLPGKVTIGHETYSAVKQFVDCRRKVVIERDVPADSPTAGQLEEVLGQLDAAPNDPALVKKAAFLFLEVKDSLNAYNHLRRALELDPHDDKVKVAYAETTLKVSELENIPVRGRSTLHLYEVIAIKNPLLDREKIPARFHDEYAPRVAKVSEYPDDLLLPVEALDGSVGHSRVVGFIAYAIADLMKLPDQEKKDVLLAGYYADIGKGIIPHHILNRTGNLTKTEFEEVVKHSRESVRLLKTMGHRSKEVFDIIAAHHERPNGAGYPEGLAGDKIPLGARIVAAADSYDSLTSWRPYRNRWEFRAAYDEMRRETEKGKFDPAVMDCLGKLLGIAV